MYAYMWPMYETVCVYVCFCVYVCVSVCMYVCIGGLINRFHFKQVRAID